MRGASKMLVYSPGACGIFACGATCTGGGGGAVGVTGAAGGWFGVRNSIVNSPGPFFSATGAGGGGGASSIAGGAGVFVGDLYPCINNVSSPGPFLDELDSGTLGGVGLPLKGDRLSDTGAPPVLNNPVNSPGALDDAGAAGNVDRPGLRLPIPGGGGDWSGGTALGGF